MDDLSRWHLKLRVKPSKRGRTNFTLRVRNRNNSYPFRAWWWWWWWWWWRLQIPIFVNIKRILCNMITGFVVEWSDTTYHTYYCIGVTCLAGRNELQPPDHLIRTDCDVITSIRSFIYHEHCDVITNVRSFVYREQHRQNRCVKWMKFTTKVFWRHFNPSRQRGRRKEQKSRRYNWGAVTRVGSHLRHCYSISTPSFPRCNCNRDNRARLRNL